MSNFFKNFDFTHVSKSNLAQRWGVALPSNLIYLDNAASTPLDTRVEAAMQPWLTCFYGNPAARLHPHGAIAENALAEARNSVATAVNADFEEVIFLSSATEANNLILRGLVEHPRRKRNKIVICATEHSSLVVTAQTLEKHFSRSLGIRSCLLPVDRRGQIDLDAAEKLIDAQTLCVCAMDANNETGIVQEHLEALIHLAHKVGAPVHIDAVQGFARGDFKTRDFQYDSLVLSSGKIYGPRGAACLVLRKAFAKPRVEAQLTGGGHEFLLRSSTPNMAAIMGFAEAVRLQDAERKERNIHLKRLEDLFSQHLQSAIEATVYGQNNTRIPGITMVSIPGVNAMKMVEDLKDVCLSVGSACRTLQATASHVLLAMGIPLEDALSSFRVSFGLANTEDEAKEAAKRIARTAHQLRINSATLERI